MPNDILTREQLMEMSDDDIIRYILTLTGYNDIIHIVQSEAESKFNIGIEYA
jgi:hypothetical protein